MVMTILFFSILKPPLKLFNFQKMDLNQDGVVSLEEFLTFNKEDFKMVQSLDSLKTINV